MHQIIPSLQEDQFWSQIRARRERREAEGDKDDFKEFLASRLGYSTYCTVYLDSDDDG